MIISANQTEKLAKITRKSTFTRAIQNGGSLDDLDRHVGVPLVGEPGPVSIALKFALICCRGVGVAHRQRATVRLQVLNERVEERNDAAVMMPGLKLPDRYQEDR